MFCDQVGWSTSSTVRTFRNSVNEEAYDDGDAFGDNGNDGWRGSAEGSKNYLYFWIFRDLVNIPARNLKSLVVLPGYIPLYAIFPYDPLRFLVLLSLDHDGGQSSALR